jgi:hypothetical protein
LFAELNQWPSFQASDVPGPFWSNAQARSPNPGASRCHIEVQRFDSVLSDGSCTTLIRCLYVKHPRRSGGKYVK